MRLSKLFFQSLREAPAEAEAVGHQFLLRAGYLRQLGAGLYDYLPLAVRVMRWLGAILRDELEALGAQEVRLPVVQPAELWRQSGRLHMLGSDLARFQDRAGRDLCLGATHEEVATALAGGVIQSYRQLPVILYQIQTKFRDEPRPRGGLVRTREFTMKDAYSFHPDEASLDETYRDMMGAYKRIFARCDLEVLSVESDPGMMGGAQAHEFMLLNSIGEDTLLLCDTCGYQANRQVATFRKEARAKKKRVLIEVATPGTATIGDLVRFLGITPDGTAKAVFFSAERKEPALVFALVRGDHEVNEAKLARVLGAQTLRPATADEIRAAGAEPGYASPIGVKRERLTLVVDEAVATSSNLVAGANRPGIHLKNTNYGRDYEADVLADIAVASAGALCIRCSGVLRAEHGIEVGNIFKLGTRYSAALGATFRDTVGREQPLVMGCYGIGVGRLLAAVAETHHDEHGLVWPAALAPYDLMLVALGGAKAPAVEAAAETLYAALQAAGVRVLYDDRGVSPGVAFTDADLIGLPWRVTVARRGVKRGVLELHARASSTSQELPLDTAPVRLAEIVRASAGST